MGTIHKIRESAGGAYEKRGQYFIRVTIAPQKRQAEHAPWATSLQEADARGKVIQAWVNRLRLAGLDEFIIKTDPNRDTIVELGAKADAETLAKLAEKVDALTGGHFDRVPSAKPLSGPVTFRTFAERWTSGELARLYPDHVEVKASVQDDIERLTNYVYPRVEHVPLRAFTREHADGIMAKLPGSLKKGTRRHVAQLVSRVLRLAVFTDALKVSPLPPGWLPKAPKAESIAKESLLPSEEAKLLVGRDAQRQTVVPLAYRVAYAFMHREGMRKGEAQRLTWGDVNLANGVVSLDENKTERPRSWVLDPGVRRVLEHWKKVNGKAKTKETDLVFVDVAWDKLAPIYRAHCEAVGIKRERLYQKKANKLRLRAHDMRAFFVTAAMFDEHDALWITDRSGHTTLGMLRTYERDVRRWRELGEAPAPADETIPEVAAANAAAKRGGSSGGGPPTRVRKHMKVHGKGVEPLRLAAAEPKSAASASFATRAVILWGNRSRPLGSR
jgi:integrase